MKKCTLFLTIIIFIFLSACQSASTEIPTPLIDTSLTLLPSSTSTPAFTPPNYPLSTPTALPLSVPEEIITLLNKYFDTRYKSIQNLHLEDFSSFIAETDEGQSFWEAEEKKLALEIEHARIYDLAYLQYEFFLGYEDILIDQSSESAKVFVIEGHDVVFEVSAPILSSQRNIAHEIELIQIDGQWKIKSDIYQDYLWRWLNTTGISPGELGEALMVLQEKSTSIFLPHNLPIEKISYNRQGAVDYAHQWSIASRPYNPDYYDFTELGGDCTNFVSQAIFEGGEIEMVFGSVHDIGTSGWYYYDISDRAMAWTWVDSLYDFIVDEQDIWGNKLIGYEVDVKDALAGDIMQFNWGADNIWNHSVLIISSENNKPNNLLLVAGHSPDVDNYPHTAMLYSDAFRFIHISSN